MNRRDILSTVTLGTVALAGCLDSASSSSNNDDADKFETCNRRVIWYDNLPDDLKVEVDSALNNGKYESDDGLLWEQFTGPGVEALSTDDQQYNPIIESGSRTETLVFEETTLTHPFTIMIENHTNKRHTASIMAKDGEEIISKSEKIDIEPGGNEHIEMGEIAIGKYEIDVIVEDHTETIGKSLHRYLTPGHAIYITEEDASIRLAGHIDPVFCDWHGAFGR